jgi:hypothetical protein
VPPRGEESAGPGANPPAEPESGSTYAHVVAGLPLVIERCELQLLVRDTSSGFTKVSIVVRLSGGSHVGEGEDITWDQIDQIEFLRGGDDPTWLHGTRTFDEFSRLLGLANLFPVGPIHDSARFYRRWAFESAALDLALRQNGLSLQAPSAVQPARSTSLASWHRSGSGIRRASSRSMYGWVWTPGSASSWTRRPDWDEALVGELARLGCVDVIDLKGCYRDANVAMEAEAGLYRRVIEGLPDAWIEDPALERSTEGMLEPPRPDHLGRWPLCLCAIAGTSVWPARRARARRVPRLWAGPDDCRPDPVSLLDGVEHERFGRLPRSRDRERFVVGGALARTMVVGYVGTSPRDIGLLQAHGDVGNMHANRHWA